MDTNKGLDLDKLTLLGSKEPKSTVSRGIVPIQLSDDAASQRLILAAAKRVITQHKDELQALAYK